MRYISARRFAMGLYCTLFLTIGTLLFIATVSGQQFSFIPNGSLFLQPQRCFANHQHQWQRHRHDGTVFPEPGHQWP